MEIVSIIIYIITAILVIAALTTIALLIKYRNHSNLKKYSPGFSCIIILGLTMNILSSVGTLNIHDIIHCKFRYVYETVDTCLIFLPMAAIVLCNYYHSSSDNQKKLTKRLSIIIAIILLMMVIYSIISALAMVSFVLENYLNLPYLHLYTCNSETGAIYDIIERIIYSLIFLSMSIFIFMKRKSFKENGSYRYVFLGLFILAIETFKSFTEVNSIAGFAVVNIIYMVGYFICIYVLIGKELVDAIKNPDPDNLNLA